jgi:hypothetical protein
VRTLKLADVNGLLESRGWQELEDTLRAHGRLVKRSLADPTAKWEINLTDKGRLEIIELILSFPYSLMEELKEQESIQKQELEDQFNE